jgi:hypothetical protein
MSLILTYAPRDDESGMGYFRRLSADNALFSWRNLAHTAGVERSRRALLTRTDDVARNLGLEPAWAESARQKEDLCRNWGRLHRAQSDAVCPACLAESPYLRHQWEHTYVTACPQHRTQLVDQCDACGKHLSPERLYVGLCRVAMTCAAFRGCRRPRHSSGCRCKLRAMTDSLAAWGRFCMTWTSTCW